MNTLKVAAHYRRDIHTEFNFNRPDNADPRLAYREPIQTNQEDTWSVAIENTFHITKHLDLVTGASYDWLLVDVAEDWQAGANPNPSNGRIIQRPTPDADARNYQAALIYSYSDSGKVHASYSDRMRFATVFERFSTRFGTAVPNPDLDPERAQNYEVGITDRLSHTLRGGINVFYSDLEDTIQSVSFRNSGSATVLSQNQNLTGNNYGIELSADWDIFPTLRVGGNYTYLERKLDFVNQPFARVEGSPQHKAFLYLAWSATNRLTITPSVELASDFDSLITSNRSTLLSPPLASAGYPNYEKLGSFTLLNLQAEYRLSDNFSAAVGGTNLLDDNYQLAQGFPEPGRQYFANVRAKF